MSESGGLALFVLKYYKLTGLAAFVQFNALSLRASGEATCSFVTPYETLQ